MLSSLESFLSFFQIIFLSFFPFGTLIMCMLVYLILSHEPLGLVCFFLLSLSVISVLVLSLLFLVNFYFLPCQASSAGVRVWIRGLVLVTYLTYYCSKEWKITLHTWSALTLPWLGPPGVKHFIATRPGWKSRLLGLLLCG